MSRVARWVTVLLLAAHAACGSSEPGSSGGAGAGGTGGTRPGDGATCGGGSDDAGGAPPELDAAPDGDCQATVAPSPIEGAQHVPICSPVVYATNPPSSGNHYPMWADYRTYDRPILRGFWVHSLEHGAVVISYNCPGGCAAEVASAQSFVDGLPADCGLMARRVILTPDPDLDVRFAASAWGFTLRANCFDRHAFADFFSAHYDHAPESICGGGTDPTELCGPSICP
ncbi:MAG TPA: DUF3105 domain-containing protein [Polyangiaceae bacterium]|nr:DUF3105 domain-containing protein [Polyangiaceae bacterium]